MTLRRILAVCIVGTLALSVTNVKAEDQADQLRAIELDRLRSLVAADLAIAKRLHADDFQLVNPRGGTLSKDQYLSDIASGALDYLEWTPEEIQVRLHGDSAVIRYRAHMKVSVRGSPGRAVTTWHTDLYEKRNGQWQVVWSQATLVEK
jgi:ketosteroid isomerase-like protein